MMELTEKEYKVFLVKKSNLKNIFDVLVLLYSYIEGDNKAKYRDKYVKFLSKYPDYWMELELLNNELLEGVLSFGDYINRFWKLLSRENIRHYAFKMLISYNRYIKEGYKIFDVEMQKSPQLRLSALGPMNTDQTKYSLYLMPKSHFFKDYNNGRSKKSRIRIMEQSEFNAVDRNITSYKIIKTDMITGKVTVVGYDSMKYALPEELRIALVPLSPCKWYKDTCTPRENNEGDIVIEDCEDKIDDINKACTSILEKCIEENVQMVAFPELTRNEKTLAVVKTFLAQQTLVGKKSLGLVFLGSIWKDYMNEGILLNGAGSELLKVYKRYAYDEKENGITYCEQLINMPDEIKMIDIPGLGRIEYSICKDGLNTAFQNCLWSIFEVSFFVISAHSKSVSHFTNLGRNFSTQYGGIQVIANSCESRMKIVQGEKQPIIELGNVIMPCACSQDMSVCSMVQKYETMEYCWRECKKHEAMGRCIRIISIAPDTTEKETLSMSLRNIIL